MDEDEVHAAHRLLHAMERRLNATRHLLRGPIDGHLAHEYLSAAEAEGEARAELLGEPRTAARMGVEMIRTRTPTES